MEYAFKFRKIATLTFIKDLFNKNKINKTTPNLKYLDESLSKHMQKDLGIETEHVSNREHTKYL